MSRDANKQPKRTATQSAPGPIEGSITSCMVLGPRGGSLELGSDGQYVYHPRRRYSMPPAEVFEYVASDSPLTDDN
jgi:hypothetical protein